jgi:hypothetical protein
MTISCPWPGRVPGFFYENTGKFHRCTRVPVSIIPGEQQYKLFQLAIKHFT